MNTEAAIAYHAVREKEGRLLSDELVRELPFSGTRVAHPGEWQVRERSMRRLLGHFRKTGGTLRVLEIGCGNGWLCARMAEAGHTVTGVDIHEEELEQARRVFAEHRIEWAHEDPFEMTFPAGTFDRVVFAASLQYFTDPGDLFAQIRPWLAQNGEIHVLDTVLYADRRSLASAQERSLAYFTQLGMPAMANYYHHHLLSDLLAHGNTRLLSAPSRWDWSRFPQCRLDDPFHHTVHTFSAA